MARKRAATTLEVPTSPKRRTSSRLRGAPPEATSPSPPASPVARKAKAAPKAKPESTQKKTAAAKSTSAKGPKKEPLTPDLSGSNEDPDPDTLPDVNPEIERHEGERYFLMKAEPETRIENGVDVRFSIDDLRAKTKPEPWEGIRNYAARNNFKEMNVGDKAFFYHSNTKEPGIVGIMEIVKEYSEDVSARRPGTAYYDPQSSAAAPRWGLVHVRFVKKFAVPIYLTELREFGANGHLDDMQMLKQTRLSVSKVGKKEFDFLCKVADDKAKKAGKKHEV